jgi:TonB family protein
MWLGNLGAYSLQLLVLVGVAGVLPVALRLRLPRALLTYWQLTLAACLLLPALEPWRHEQVASVTSAAPVVVVTGAHPAAPAPRPFPARQAVAVTLAAGFAARLLWLAIGLGRLGAYRRRARPLETLPEPLAEMQDRLGVYPEVRVSEEVRSPVTFGLRRPVLLLPSRFLEMEAGPQTAIACHELMHVRRRDWAWTIFEELVRAVLWFHPAIWWLLGRIQLAREQVVDAEVIELTQARRHYLEALLEVANVPRPAVAALAPLFLRKRHFAQRVALILKEVSMSRLRLILSLTVMAAGVALASGLAARAFPLEGAPEFVASEDTTGGGSGQEASPPTTAQKIRVGGSAQQKKLIHQVPPVYPPLAKQARIQGTVRLTAIIGKDGTVQDVQLVSGHPLLVPAAMEAVRQWRYEPTLLNGEPVEVITQIDVNFTLSGAGPGEAVATAAGVVSEAPAARPFASIGPEKGVRRIQVPAADQEEKLIYKAGPVYPPLAQQAGVRGTVTCRILIAADGAVKAVQPARGHPLLIPPVIEAVKQYRYRSTTVDGQPAEVVTEVEVKVPAGELPAAAAVPDVESPGDVYKVGPGVTSPKLIRKTEPQYTEEARDAKLEGTVILTVEVWPDGKIHNAQVKKGLGKGLEEKALEAVEQWEFRPATKDGQPVKVRATIETNFRLMDNPPAK